MSEPAAILATFSDLKLVKGRKCAQLIFEVPIEQAASAVTILGMPNPAKEIWCGIAVTNLKGSTGSADESRLRAASPAQVEPFKAELADGDHSGQLAQLEREQPPARPNPHIRRFMALANDTGFWNFTRRIKGQIVKDASEAETLLKFTLGIKSKTELTDGSEAAETLRVIAHEFNNWMRK